jgi:exodeoxyribonuclease V alpha subunit
MTEVLDLHDARRVHGADGLLGAFNAAGVLVAADVHVATRLAALAGEADETVQLAAALAVRGPRLGHTCVDLTTIAATATVDVDEEVDLSALPWPEEASWLEAVRASGLVAVGEGQDAPADRPLRLVGTTLYLDRYWREECQVAADLRALRTRATDVDLDVLAQGLDRFFGRIEDADQHRAAATAIQRRFAVVGGGPGTGKTTTVGRIVALLFEQAHAAGRPAPLIAMAAPTARAAAQLEAAVHAQDVGGPVWAGTLHRLLGGRPGTTRYRHNRGNRLPHDVVIVDESSMVELSMMARLVQAIRPSARLLLVGDPNQLTPVGAGAVLADIVSDSDTADDVVLLEHERRFGGEISAVADAIRRGDPDATVQALRDVTWIEVDPDDPAGAAALVPLRERVVATQRAVHEAAQAGQASDALEALRSFRLMCAHRRGPYGVARWTAQIEAWLEAALPGSAFEPHYLGRPLLVTRNDPALRLSNGDLGVIVRSGTDERTAAFARGSEVVEVRPSRLDAVETVHAMTIHKSQGSQFDTAAVLLPAVGSRLLTRELLYTAVTRARHRLLLVGTEESVRAAVERPVARASGLGARLSG